MRNPSPAAVPLAAVPQAAVVRRSWAADLDPATLYALLKLRVDVFVAEQNCPYPELDGRDLEPRARHYWLAGGSCGSHGSGPVLGTLRLLKEPDGGYRVGRLCVVKELRSNGLGTRLMDAVLAEVSDGDCVLDAQTPHVGFYSGFGFAAIGDPYDWDGIEHVPMRRPRRVRVS